MKMYGWYSQTAAEIYGSVFYSTPTGIEVEVTLVSESNVPPNWEDICSVGEVTDYIRVGRPDAIGNRYYFD